MNYWRIVAGHPEKNESEEVKSMQLGDWLRKNYVGMGHESPNPMHEQFKTGIQINDKVVVTTDKHVWALGTIVGDMETTARGRNTYPYRRRVVWSKVTKVSYKDFPKTLKGKLGYNHALNRLKNEDWETLLMYV